MKTGMIIALLSTTVLPLDGTYTVQRLENIPNVTGLPHYIGHPDTKRIVENMGAIQSESRLFESLLPGQSAIACSIQHGMSTRATQGFTNPHQEVTVDMLEFRLITRAEVCCMCKQEARIYPFWSCSSCGAT